jgi:histidinol phosphatase-like PHP family hydrolase
MGRMSAYALVTHNPERSCCELDSTTGIRTVRTVRYVRRGFDQGSLDEGNKKGESMGPYDPVYADFHVHTRFSPCGHPDATITAMVARARDKGLAALGFADHVTPHVIPGCGFYDGQQMEVLAEMRKVVAALPDASTNRVGLELLVGVEADYTLAGAGCLDAKMIRLVDHVVCSASHFHLPAAPVPAEDTPLAKARLMVALAREMLRLDGVTIWAHPFDCSAMRPLAPIMAEIDEATQADLITWQISVRLPSR